MGKLQVWGEVDDSVFDDIDNEFKSAGGSEFMKLGVGKNIVRFLPPIKGKKSHVKLIQEHFIDELPGHEGTFRFVCPRAMAKQRCPQCEQADKLLRSGNVVDRKAAKKMYPSLRVYSNVINRKAPEEGPKILTFGKQIWEQLKAIKDDTQDGGAYWNPGEDGFDIVINRTGTGKMDTEYKVLVARNNSPLHEDDDQAAEWAEKAFDLDYYAALMDPAELLDALGGGAPRRSRSAMGGGGGRAALPAGSSAKSTKSPGRAKPARRTAQDDVDVLDADYDAVDEDDDVPL